MQHQRRPHTAPTRTSLIAFTSNHQYSPYVPPIYRHCAAPTTATYGPYFNPHQLPQALPSNTPYIQLHLQQPSHRSQPSTHNQQSDPQQNQFAARHVISRDLPTFSGRPEEWPIFISSYENTTTCSSVDLTTFSNWLLQLAMTASTVTTPSSDIHQPNEK